MASFMNQQNHNPNNSFEVVQPLTDSVSSLSFSPNSNLLVATSWDNQVRCWDIQKSGTNISSCMPKSYFLHDQPVLCSTWKDDGMTLFSGGCGKKVKMWSLTSGGHTSTVSMHEAPIRHIAWIPELSVLVTGSWDKTMKYWDLRQPNPVHTQQLPERCYALSVRQHLMVVGTADRNLIIFNLKNTQVEFKRIISPLKYQTKSDAAFPDQQGFLVGSIEGRVAVQHVDDGQESKKFTFKCHRDNNDLYSVNSISFHPVYRTFSTTGSDGTINFWDNDSKQRLNVCYDWHKGAVNHNPSTAKTSIFLHLPQEADVKPKPKTSGRR